MDNQRKKEVARAFAAGFAESLGEALTSATGTLWPLEISSSPTPPTQKGMPVHFRLSVEGSFSGECFVELNEPQVTHLLSEMQKEPVQDLTDVQSEVFAKVITTATESLVAARAGEY